ncbi:hypothetical protein LF887_00015 [Chryseobacterium sp. MEBOG06]|uniref:hypothetical protein n=1 Tax=Chryseobacterium sp. MEBOG06 TaxID=2879938 RepID=UPI001F1DDE8A|nr:hypothetical protein [Chryseobacterium sp. MEBOG06]UKB84068.1 hypothetical protein LF887_00015 [Chryseobacterium sp. MEBOG06]
MVSRKRFLQLSALSAGSLLIPSFFFSKSTLSPQNFLTNDDINTLLKSAKTFCKEKKWAKAKGKYEQIISSRPQEVRAYDGLRRCIFQKPKQESAYLQILETAVQQYPENKELKQRLYSQYIKIATGNKKVSRLKNKNLLSVAQNKLSELALQHPDDKCLQHQLAKVNKLISFNAGDLHHKKNTNIKQLHKQNQKLFKARFDLLTNDQLSTKLTQLKNKPYKKERENHIRELYLILIKRNIKSNGSDQAIVLAKEYHSLYPKDRSAVYWIRRLGKQKRDFQTLLAMEEKNHTVRQNFWSAASYYNAAKKSQPSNSSKLQLLLSDMEQKKTDENQEFILQCKKIDFYLLQNQTTEAENKLNVLLKTKAGIKNTSIIDSVNTLVIRYLKKTSQENITQKYLYLVINAKDLTTSSDSWEQKIAQLNQNRNFSKSIYIEKLQKYLNKV